MCMHARVRVCVFGWVLGMVCMGVDVQPYVDLMDRYIFLAVSMIRFQGNTELCNDL